MIPRQTDRDSGRGGGGKLTKKGLEEVRETYPVKIRSGRKGSEQLYRGSESAEKRIRR